MTPQTAGRTIEQAMRDINGLGAADADTVDPNTGQRIHQGGADTSVAHTEPTLAALARRMFGQEEPR